MIDIRKTNHENTLIHRGDTCIQIDPLVTKENYIGKTVAFERNGKVYHLDAFDRKNKRIVWLSIIRIAPLFFLKVLLIRLERILG